MFEDHKFYFHDTWKKINFNTDLPRKKNKLCQHIIWMRPPPGGQKRGNSSCATDPRQEAAADQQWVDLSVPCGTRATLSSTTQFLESIIQSTSSQHSMCNFDETERGVEFTSKQQCRDRPSATERFNRCAAIWHERAWSLQWNLPVRVIHISYSFSFLVAAIRIRKSQRMIKCFFDLLCMWRQKYPSWRTEPHGSDKGFNYNPWNSVLKAEDTRHPFQGRSDTALSHPLLSLPGAWLSSRCSSCMEPVPNPAALLPSAQLSNQARAADAGCEACAVSQHVALWAAHLNQF